VSLLCIGSYHYMYLKIVHFLLCDTSSRNTPPGDPSGGVVYLRIVLSPEEIWDANLHANGRSHLSRVSTRLILTRRISPTITHKQLTTLYVSSPKERTLSFADRSTHHPANKSRPSRSQPRHSNSADNRRHLATFRL